MSLKLRALHGAALIAGVQFTYVCRFYSADLSKKSPGRKVWEVMDVLEALRLWSETIGAEHDQGQFTLTLEAQVGEAGTLPRSFQPKTHGDPISLDFWEEPVNGGVPAELSPAQDVRAEVAGERAAAPTDGRGGAAGSELHAGDAP